MFVCFNQKYFNRRRGWEKRKTYSTSKSSYTTSCPSRPTPRTQWRSRPRMEPCWCRKCWSCCQVKWWNSSALESWRDKSWPTRPNRAAASQNVSQREFFASSARNVFPWIRRWCSFLFFVDDWKWRSKRERERNQRSLLLSHLDPVQPVLHSQTALFLASIEHLPYLHGFLAHLSADSHFLPTKPAGHLHV